MSKPKSRQASEDGKAELGKATAVDAPTRRRKGRREPKWLKRKEALEAAAQQQQQQARAKAKALAGLPSNSDSEDGGDGATGDGAKESGVMAEERRKLDRERRRKRRQQQKRHRKQQQEERRRQRHAQQQQRNAVNARKAHPSPPRQQFEMPG